MGARLTSKEVYRRLQEEESCTWEEDLDCSTLCFIAVFDEFGEEIRFP